MNKMMSHIVLNLNTIQSKMTTEKLLIVTKGRDFDAIKQLIAANQHCFGENYLQEALLKIAAVRTMPVTREIEWHFIGKIQPNKTRKIAENFSWVQSVDNSKIAERLNDQRPTQLPPLQICIQVNIDQDENKGGVDINETAELANFIATLPRLQLRGLMTIPKKHATLAEREQSYQQMKLVYDQLKKHYPSIDTLSMGMSDDFEVALQAGATLVRIGHSVFAEN
jgi:PLP dependent protein